MFVQRNTAERSRTTAAVEKAVSIKYYVCVCLFSCLIYPECKAHLFYEALYRHVWPVWSYHLFPQYLINGKIFAKKKKYWTNTCFDFLNYFCQQELSFQEKLRKIHIINVQRSSRKVLAIFVRFERNFLERFSKNTYQISWKSVRVVPSGRKDMTL
jgi:hypothetical protein